MWGDGGDAGSNAKANVAEPTQLLHHGIHLPGIWSLRVKNGFGVIEDQNHLVRGQERSQGGEVLRILDTCADGLGEPAEKMWEGSGELVTANESAVITEPCLDASVVKDGQRDGRLSDSSGTDESNRFQVFSETDDLLDQLIASETCPRWWGWGFPMRTRCKRQMLSDSPAV